LLEGKRILVLEDEPLVAMLLEEMLLDLGCEVVGPAYSLEQGERLAAEAELDAAVLDVNVNGEMSDPVANALKARGVPFALATGYGLSAPMAAGGRIPVLQKPYPAGKLEATLRQLLGG
jgi:CheY-like chemotaxis protein